MKKYILAGILLAACSSGKEKKVLEPITYMKIMGVFTGVTPCADCEGIYTRLEFIDSVTFLKASKYLGKSSRAFHDMGQWKIENDSTIALQAHGSTQRYLFEDHGLVMLTSEGKRIQGPLASYYRLAKGEPAAESNNTEKAVAGIDFTAGGNDPYWSLEIDFNGNLFFSDIEGDSIRINTPPPTQDGTTINLKLTSEDTALSVALSPTGCIDAVSGAYSDFRVDVNYNDVSLQGCGSFINDLYMLHGTWRLSTLGGDLPKETSYPKGLPELTFNVMNNVVSGHTGCNQLTGTFKAETAGSLTFSPLATTRMTCAGANENALLGLFKQVNSFRISGEQLILSKGELELAVFTSY